jgi:hypothetical protein
MNHTSLITFVLLAIMGSACGPQRNPSGKRGADVNAGEEPAAAPLKLYDLNPRYLEYQGAPVLLVTSAEHYGAVLNMDFDYLRYLETLQKEGFNYTRIFGGTYIEPVENIFGIQRNTLAPLPGRFLAPWLLTEEGYDLERFNPDYFDRLTGFLEEAQAMGIIVELTLFTSIYADNAWELSPLNPSNNINIDEPIAFRKVNTLLNGPLREYQEQYTRKLVRETNRFDNLFFEIQNEPWADNGTLVDHVNMGDDEVFRKDWQKRVEVANGASLEWQAWVATVIRAEEAGLPKKHLINQNISNFTHQVDSLPQGVSMINFHYALPSAVTRNLGIGGVIGLDETGFMPHEDHIYIHQAWRFILAGGGVYNNLDYSFTAGNETGEWPIPETNPGWGGPGFREKLAFLVETIHQVPFYEMVPSDSILLQDTKEMQQIGLMKPGEICLLLVEDYLESDMIPDLPVGEYEVSWIDINEMETVTQRLQLDGLTSLGPPIDADPIVLMIRNLQTNP